MALPEYWWLLVPACLGQALFFLRPDAFRRTPLKAPVWALAGLCCGGAAGLAYGLVQSDPVLLAGQLIVLAGVAVGTRRTVRRAEDRKS
ncbi:MAG TPA: hypothetical protein PKB11_04915 [Desulfovibrio sp.]|jgi:hypothetical protein|uniref:hypothetical protein n=1 Tax=Desulfovibrio TaxID=872 RepID=UPI0004008E57|nr:MULTISPECIES: hypothetical protein [Desulfovibrio]HMM38078.1 hypothetical protein [Desulfovibrio sp.]